MSLQRRLVQRMLPATNSVEDSMITPDFNEKLVLLVLTVLIGGLGAPWVLKRVDEARLRKSKIIEAQSQLLLDISRTLWSWRYLAKQVAFYAAEANFEKFDRARKKYDDDLWELLNEFRAQASKAMLYASASTYEKLIQYYDYLVKDVDPLVSELGKVERLDPPAIERGRALAARFSDEVSRKIDQMIDEVAGDLGLKAAR
jgi:hypothetical protein